LWRDEGKESYGDVGKWWKDNKIEAYLTYKANVAECFNRTMMKIKKY
jgi:hypothetical protein